jgi:hypothetical protein
MRQLAMLATGFLLVGIATGLAKKPAKPIIETFEATVPGAGVMRVEIEEFSTDQDMQELARTYDERGKDAVESTLRRTEKGRCWIGDRAKPIRLARSASQGGTRSLFIVADAADRIDGEFGGHVSIGHRGYDFTFVQLRIDQQTKGVGLWLPFVEVVFNKQGIIDVKSMPVGSGANASTRLTDVHAVGQ